MRIDQYLWAVRYFKSRSQAAGSCQKGHVILNGKKVKAAKEVFPGDNILLRKNQITYHLTVLDIPASRVGAKIKGLYVNDTTPQAAFDNQKIQILMSNGIRDKGTGRPTKKERREWEEWYED